MGLDVVQLVMHVEQRYGITVSDADARTMRSVGDLHRYILLRAEPRPDDAEVWTWLREMIETDFGVPAERITPDAWIVRDLGLN